MKIGSEVVKRRKLILLVGILLMIPAVIGMLVTRVNYDMLTYLPADMETMTGEKILMKDFNKGGFSLVVVEGMKSGDVARMSDEIEEVDHVGSVLNMDQLLDPTVPKEVYPEELRDAFGKKGATMLAVFFDTSTSDERTLNAVKKIRGIVSKNSYVSGMSALVLDLKNLAESEEPKYVVIAVILSLIIMMFLMDSYLAPVLFLGSIGMAILYNLGSNLFLGEVAYITKAIAAVLQLGVTMDYSIFLWHSYSENLRQEKDHNVAMAKAIDSTLTSVTGSSITTVAGFLALCFMTYKMGMNLGLVMAKGCAIGVIASVTLLPAIILASDKLIEKTRHKPLIPDMSGVAKVLTKHSILYIVIFGLMIVPAVYGYNNAKVSYDFAAMFEGKNQLSDEQAPFLKANDKLAEDFGIGCTHMVIADNELTQKKGYQMSRDIKKVKGVKNVLGIDSFLSPDIPREMLPSKVRETLMSDTHQLILVNSEYDVSSDACNDQVDKIDSIIKKYDKGATVIGEGPATKDLISLTKRDFEVVNFISILAVFLIIFFVLKSWTLPVILVSVIEFAIYVNLGIPGYTGLELPFIVPVCISTIQLGSTVDYAILMSTRYKKERMSGKSKYDAVEKSVATSIPSILVSAFGFFTATFGVGVYSDIGIISTLCNLMARGAVISMLSVILILPSLLLLFDKLILRTTSGMREIYRSENGGLESAAE